MKTNPAINVLTMIRNVFHRRFFTNILSKSAGNHRLTYGAYAISGLVLMAFALISIAKEKPVVEAAEEQHTEAAVLTAEQLKVADIGLEAVGAASIRETLSLYGKVVVNAERVQHVNARFPGVIRSVNKQPGDAVVANETLATVEGDESLRSYLLTSSIAGVITERNANPGEHTSDQPLLVVADLSSLWVELTLFPRDIARVHVGQLVRVINPINNLTAEGEIIAIAPLGNSVNQTLTARVLLNNNGREWVPGLFVNAEVILATASVAISVRNEGLHQHEGQQVIFVQDKQGFVPRAVKLGRSDGEHSEVLSGVIAGERYASRNSFIIKAELGKGGVEHD